MEEGIAFKWLTSPLRLIGDRVIEGGKIAVMELTAPG